MSTQPPGGVAPRFSVIIPAYHSHGTVAECLEALRAQSLTDHEVIVVDSSPDPRPLEAVVRAFPEVRRIHSEERMLPHTARNRGAREARGEVLVFTDPDCRADPDWLERLDAVHRAGKVFVGGSVGCLPSWRNRAIHTAKYAWWWPGGRAGPVSQIPSANTSVTRDFWNRLGGYEGRFMSGDSDLSFRASELGARVWFEPGARVTHLDHGPLWGCLRTTLARGRDYGAMRVRRSGWGRVALAGRVAATPLVPLVMLARSGAAAVRAGHVGAWISVLPYATAAVVLWAAGEARAHVEALWAP